LRCVGRGGDQWAAMAAEMQSFDLDIAQTNPRDERDQFRSTVRPLDP